MLDDESYLTSEIRHLASGIRHPASRIRQPARPFATMDRMSHAHLPLENKTVVIIGGTGGLGFSAAQACIAAGASVLVVGRDLDRAIAAQEKLGEQARFHVGDAADPDTAPQAIALAMERFGQFDALYHVAGGSGRKFGDGPLDAITDEGWQRTLDLNLSSLFYSNRAAVRQFLAQGTGGSVLNMGSVLDHSPSPRHFATHTYATTKAATVGLTHAAAAYYAAKNIRFNVLAPALVATPLAGRAMNDPAIMQYIATKQPLDGGRIGTPEDLDAAVVFFLSDQSKFVTGQVLYVDGGWTLSEGRHGEG
jgi:NAD(P)-dependent dehydrogenase (short-subunit alcohol dehydrogenase family)